MTSVTTTGTPARTATDSVEIIEVTSRRLREAFIRLPWRIYRNDPLWVPPLLMDRREFIDPRRHPFFLHGAATQFLARVRGELVGRVLVSDDPRYNAQHRSNIGCFGMFESTDDPRVAHALLDAAAGWLAARGRDAILGPIDYSTNYTCGLLVEGFDTPPRVLMNHNPPYYRDLLESWGLEKAKDLYCWWFRRDAPLETRWMKVAERLRQRGSITIRPFRIEHFESDLEACKRVYNEAWQDNWGFVRMTDAEFHQFAIVLRRFVPMGYMQIAEVEGKVVGMAISLPDFNEAMRPLGGKLFPCGVPIGLVRYLRNLRRIRTSRLITLGVLEQYRSRGVAELLILETFRYGRDVANLEAAELGWTLEDNDRVNSAIKASGAKRYKTYRIFQRSI